MKLQTPTEEYHKMPQLSSSSLSNFVSYDLWTGRRTTNYMNFLYPTHEETDAMLLGTLVDAILTEWQEFDRTSDHIGDYQIVGRRTGKYEKEILQSLADEVYAKVDMIHRVPQLKQLFATSEKQVVLTATLDWTELRWKLDLLAPSGVVDLKCSGLTTESWEKNFLDPRTGVPSPYARYVRQLAFYRMLCRLNDIPHTSSQIVLVAKDGVKWYEIPQSTIDKAEALIIADINNLKEQNDSNLLTTFPEVSPQNEQSENKISFADF